MAAVSAVANASTPTMSGNTDASNSLSSSEKRLHIIREIRQSEESYVEKLNLIFTLFYGPLHVNPILDKAEVDAIFSNIVELRRINLELLSTLREHRTNPGQAFTRLAPFLKFYALYAENFNRAVSTLQDCVQRNEKFAGFKQSQERRPACQALKLEGFLIMPVQRVPRYRLLLKDLLKHTPETHPDYTMLKTSYDQICEVASHINEYIRKHENFQKMLSIQQSLVGSGDYRIIMPGRHFLKEGRLMKVCRKKNKERAIFLFSDQLVYAKPRARLQGVRKESTTANYVFRAALPLVSCDVVIIPQHERVPNIKSLLLIQCQSSSLILFSSSPQEIESWFRVVQDAVRQLKKTHQKLVEQMSRRNSRSVVLTNTMLKGTRKLKSQNSLESAPLMAGSPISIQSDYPLRYSVMSQQQDAEDDDVEPSHATSTLPIADLLPGDVKDVDRLPIDLSESQDVDDLLLALASMDSMDNTDSQSVDSDLPQAPVYAEVKKTQNSTSQPAPLHNGESQAPRSTPPLTKPLEKFSRNGPVSSHQVTANQTTANGRSHILCQPERSPISTAQRTKLAGQGPSFRRRPPSTEKRAAYNRNAREDTPSPDQEFPIQKSHTLIREGNGHTDHYSASDTHTLSLDRKLHQSTNTSKLTQGVRSASVSTAMTGHRTQHSSSVADHSSHGTLSASNTPYRSSPDSDPDQRGTLRKEKQVLADQPPLRIIQTDSGQLTYEHVAQDELKTDSHKDITGTGEDNDKSPLLEPNRVDTQGERKACSVSPSSEQPPMDDPVVDLGCGGFRTTTYSFETGTTQSRLCVIQ